MHAREPFQRHLPSDMTCLKDFGFITLLTFINPLPWPHGIVHQNPVGSTGLPGTFCLLFLILKTMDLDILLLVFAKYIVWKYSLWLLARQFLKNLSSC